MSPKHRNLLEAFKTTGTELSRPAGAGASPGAGTPRPRGGGGTTLSSARLQMLVLAQLILIVVAFLLGRASVKGVEASGDLDGGPAAPVDDTAGTVQTAATPSEPALASSSEPQAPPAASDDRSRSAAQVDPRPQTDAERALLDTTNQYTIKLVEYANTSVNLQLAQDTLRYVTGVQSMPACLAGTGTRLYVLIGAAPTKAELEALLERARKMNGPPPLSKRGEFHDAYLEKIDKVFQRK